MSLSKKQKMDETLQENQPQNSIVMRNSLRFNDIESAFKRFDGTGLTNIETWTKQFNDRSNVLQLNELEKFIFARKLMEGRAKLFTEYESTATTYNELVDELLEEFGDDTNSALIHEILRKRRKKSDETVIEYYYEMMSIASRSKLESAALIHHIVNGLPGQEHSKAYLFDNKNMKEFKKKLEIFQQQHEKSQIATTTRCGNCGENTHKTSSCPRKNDGPLCFACKKFGHRSIDESCPLKHKNVQIPQVATMRSNQYDSEEEEIDRIVQGIHQMK